MKVTFTLGKLIVTSLAVLFAAVLLFTLFPRASASENKSITILADNGEKYLVHRDQESKLDGSVTVTDTETGDTAIVMMDGSVILTTGQGETLTGKIVTD